MQSHVNSRRALRKVCSRDHGDLVVILAPEGIYFRQPRGRTKFLLPYGFAFQKAAFLHAEVTKRERRAARKARRTGRGT